MKVKTIVDNENGKKWEIYKHENVTGFPYPVYTVKYYEFFSACGWREIRYGKPEYCTKDYIEWEFETTVA